MKLKSMIIILCLIFSIVGVLSVKNQLMADPNGNHNGLKQSTWYYIIINEPGYHELTDDIINCTFEVGIYINASHVILDGKGHILDGVNDTRSKFGIYINDVTNVTVRNIKTTKTNIIKQTTSYKTDHNINLRNTSSGAGGI